jgi:hypothetical protein
MVGGIEGVASLVAVARHDQRPAAPGDHVLRAPAVAADGVVLEHDHK